MVDISHTLDNIECDLEDILNVYKIYHNRFRDLPLKKVIKCDRVITKMGFDKEWSDYYYNSRICNNLTSLDHERLFTEADSKVDLEPQVELPDNVLAVREIRVYNYDEHGEVNNITLHF